MRGVADQVAPGVHRLGSGLVSFYLLEEDGRYTLVDAGLPRMFEQIPALISALGADLHDVDAVVLTHAHADHVGTAERMRTEAQATVHVHDADAQIARTTSTAQTEGSIASSLWRPATMRLVAHHVRNGGLRVGRIEDVRTFADGAVLDVPGRPAVVHTPGHTHGHVALHLPDRGVLFAGDALCTRNPLTGATGPQLMPRALSTSTEQAVTSLARLAPLPADVVLVGHGEPWRDGPAAAVERALADLPGVDA